MTLIRSELRRQTANLDMLANAVNHIRSQLLEDLAAGTEFTREDKARLADLEEAADRARFALHCLGGFLSRNRPRLSIHADRQTDYSIGIEGVV